MDLSLGDVLLAGANGTGGNFGTMTPQEEATAVTPGSVLDAVANRGVQLAATPGSTYQGTPTAQPGQMSDEDMARQLLNEGATNKNAFDAAALMVGAGGAPADEGAIGSGVQPGHVLGITRDKLANAEDAINESFDRLNIPGEDWLYDKLEAGRIPGADQLADYFSLGSGSKKLAAPAIVGNAPLLSGAGVDVGRDALDSQLTSIPDSR